MATDNPTVTQSGDFTVITYTYAGLDNGDDGTPFKVPEFADKTVQVIGTFGSGGSVTLECSNQAAPSADADYFPATDGQGNAATFTAAGGEVVAENPLFMRPHVTAGDGTTDLSVVFVCRRQTDKRS